MEAATIVEWKQFKEAMDRKDIGPFPRHKYKIDDNGVSKNVMEYRNADGEPIIRMITEIVTQNNKIKEFEIDADIKEAVAYIFIPTDEQREFWDDPFNDICHMDELIKVDPGYAREI